MKTDTDGLTINQLAERNAEHTASRTRTQRDAAYQ